MTQYTIPQHKLDQLSDIVARLSRRATKLGLSPLTMKILVSETREIELMHKDGVRRTHIVDWHTIELTGEPPIIAGWQFVATIEPTPAGNILRAFMGNEISIPDYYRTVESKCDHCQTIRRRNDTYLVYNAENNEYKQVGSTCLRDFLGHRNPHMLAKFFEGWMLVLETVETDDDEPCDYDVYAGRSYVSVERFLTLTAEEIRKHGFVSRGAAKENFKLVATADIVVNVLHGKIKSDVTPEDVQMAKNARQYVLDHCYNATNDYVWNLYVALSNEVCTYRDLGIIASAISFYTRELARIEAEQRKAQEAQSEHIGQIGERITFTDLICTKEASFEGTFGTTFVYTLEDPQGNKLVWFSSKNCMSENDKITVTATIKDHTVWNGEKQTQITRGRIQK